MSRRKRPDKPKKIAVPVQSDGFKLFLQKGRLWTSIEHGLLLSVCDEIAQVDQIHEKAGLPIPVVHAALLGLMNAGWVEYVVDDDSVGFRATDYGRVASNFETLPRIAQEVSRNEYFVVDLVLGNVFRRSECARLYWEKFVPDDAVRLEPLVTYTPTLKARVAEELVREDETLTTYSNEKEHISRKQYLVVERVGSLIRGLPVSAPLELRTTLLDLTNSSSSKNKLAPATTPSKETFSLVFEDRQLVTGGRAHQQLLSVFLSSARRYVCIHSTFLAARDEQLAKTQREILPLLKEATIRGVQIDILWGQNEAEGWAVYQKWRSFILENELEELVRLHSVSTLSHAKFVLADIGGARFRLALGSCNWLASPFRKFEISMIIEDQRLVGRFLREFSSKLRGHHLSVEGEFHKELFLLSGELLRKQVDESANAGADLVVGADHQSVYLEYVDTAQKQLTVASHRLGRNALNAIFAPLEGRRLAKDVTVQIYFELLGDLAVSDLRDIQEKVPAISIRKLPSKSFHGKFMSKDASDVVVTSQNLLSATPGHQDDLDEIGVRVKRKKLANVLLSRFQSISSKSQPI